MPRRSPWTPIFNPDPSRGAINVGATPATLPGPDEWWIDFSNTDSYSLSGAEITTATDLTGTQVDLTQGTSANRPTLISAAYNGLDCARFDGSNDHLFSTSSFLGDPPTSGMIKTFMVVAATIGATTGRYFLAQGSSSGTTPVWGFQRAASNNPLFFTRQTLPGNVFTFSDEAAGSMDNTLHLYTFTMDRASFTATCSVDGGAVDVQTAGNLAYFSGDRTTLGALIRNGGVEFPTNIDICEIRMWDYGLSASALAAQTSYLVSKWGV